MRQDTESDWTSADDDDNDDDDDLDFQEGWGPWRIVIEHCYSFEEGNSEVRWR